jgi:hypothetical protein
MSFKEYKNFDGLIKATEHCVWLSLKRSETGEAKRRIH